VEEKETDETPGQQEAEEQMQNPYMGEPQMQQPFMGNPYMYNPYMYPPPGYPPMQGYMPYPPYPPYMPPYPPQYGFQPAPPPPQDEHCGHHRQEDPMGGIMGMFGQMIEGNPQLAEVGRMVNATGSDFIKGLVMGAGLAMLLSSESVRSSLSDILGKTVGMFAGDSEEQI
jgi:hypothetical protein